MKNKRKLTPWLYSMPALILIGMVIVFPIIYTGYISLTNMNLFHWSNYEFIGLSNYSRALLKADSGFLGALFTTLLWTTLNMVIQVVVAYFIALGFQREDLKGKRVYKTLLMFPWAMPAYVSILLWMALPFMIMMIDGALSSIDRSYYESAELDGAGFWSKNIHITVPAMKGIIAPAVIMTTFTTFKQFDIVYLLTMQKGAYSGATLQTIITYAQQNAFVSNNYGLSSAVSIIIFFLIMVFSLFTNRGVKEENYD